MNNYFEFKKFRVEQSLCAMKVGTDGVLIGAWCALPTDGAVARVLDIGCGSGVISLMMAQRASGVVIDAIDIEQGAVSQSCKNIDMSPWKERISVYQCRLQDFTQGVQYDYIVSNPPYFINSFKDSGNESRMVARHADTLSYVELCEGVSRLLADNGIFSVILPYVEANLFVVEAAKRALYCVKRVDIKGTPSKPVKRVMMQFSRVKQETENETMTIELDQRHKYSKKYVELTKDFYLKF